MTDEQTSAANMILNKMIFGDPRTLGDTLFKSWMAEEREKNRDDRFANIILDETDFNYNIVHGFLLENGYIGRVSAGREEKYLTEKGNNAKKLGGINEYLTWEKRKKCVDVAKEIAFWTILITSIISAGYAVVSYHFSERTKREPASKSDSTTLQLRLDSNRQQANAAITDSPKYRDSLAMTKNMTKLKDTQLRKSTNDKKDTCN